jgi:hypothetical protein
MHIMTGHQHDIRTRIAIGTLCGLLLSPGGLLSAPHPGM